MDIEKTLSVAAPAATVWALLLDPQVMGGCVPGMLSIDVISDVEYVSVIHVKIAFVSAKFKLRTTIVEQRAPFYLRTEGTGEDASVASSLKQQSEIFLTELPDGQTELRIKVTVDVLGRLGTFGLSVMKTKADRMWDEFGANLRARIEGDASGEMAAAAPAAPVVSAAAPKPAPAPAPTPTSVASAPAPAVSVSPRPVDATATRAAANVSAATVGASASAPAAADPNGGDSWWSRLIGKGQGAQRIEGRTIRVEVRDHQRTVTVEWPVEAAEQCRAWLREVMPRA